MEEEAIQQEQDTQQPADNAPPEESSAGIRVFVYGTLKKGNSNHDVLRGSNFLGECAIGPGMAMVHLGWYPGVIRQVDGAGEVHGEVYRVDEPTLHSLDAIEGHPTFYKRYKVTTPWKSAWCYCLPKSYLGEGPIVAGGLWDGSTHD